MHALKDMEKSSAAENLLRETGSGKEVDKDVAFYMMDIYMIWHVAG